MTGTGTGKPCLVIRADAGLAPGTGHVMRCIALAQAWLDAGGSAAMGMVSGAGTVAERLTREGIALAAISGPSGSVDDASDTEALARRLEAHWIVIDGYWASGAYQSALRSSGRVLMVLDDTGELTPYDADVIVNQNLHAIESLYRDRRQPSVLLLGPSFALLRREFRGRSAPARKMPAAARRILVTLGGSDPTGATVDVMKALRPLAATAEIRVVVGPANPRGVDIADAAQRWGFEADILRDTEDFATLLSWADLAVSAGGSTCWELAFAGVPFVTVVVADNQTAIAESLERAGVSRNAGWHETLDEASLGALVGALAADAGERQRMSDRGRALVDGRGAQRVVERLRTAEAA